MALVKLSYFFCFITLSSFLTFSVHSASESSAPPIFSPDEISTPKSALKAVSKILEGRIKFNENFKTFISSSDIGEKIRKEVAISILMPTQSLSARDIDLESLKSSIDCDLEVLTRTKKLADTLLPFHNNHCSLLWVHAFQPLIGEKRRAQNRIRNRIVGEIESEYDTFFSITTLFQHYNPFKTFF